MTSLVVPAPAPEEPSYLINDYRRNWFDILRTRDEQRGYIPSPTPTPESPPPKKKRKRRRSPSPVFGSPPNRRRAIRDVSPSLGINGVPTSSEIADNQITTNAPEDIPQELETDLNVAENIPSTSGIAVLENITLIEAKALIKKYEEYWQKKIDNGAEIPIWWNERERYNRTLLQRILDVKNFKIYPVANPDDMKVC